MGAETIATAREPKSATGRLKITFWLDMAMLVSICALQTVRFTGLLIHEWLGLTIVGMVFAHLLFAWSWIASQSRRFLNLPSIRARFNYLLNLTLFAAVTAVIFSGILISQKAIPALTGVQPTPAMDWRWDTLHNRFSETVLMLVGFHLAINWEWILGAGQRIFRRFLEGTR
jgi:cytochrome b561